MTETLTEKLDKLIGKVEARKKIADELIEDYYKTSFHPDYVKQNHFTNCARQEELQWFLSILRTFRAEVEGKLLTEKEYDKIGSGWGFSIATDNKLRFFAGKGGRASVDTATEDEQVRDSKSVETSATRNKEAETKLT